MTEEVTNLIATPDGETLRAIARRGRDSYSMATDNGWSQRESEEAAYEAVYLQGVRDALSRSATETREAQAQGYNDAITDAVDWARSQSGYSADAAADYIEEMAEAQPYRPVAVVPEDPKPETEHILTVRDNPEVTDERLAELYDLAVIDAWGGDVIALANSTLEDQQRVGFRAIWRDGCDTGMVTP